jgi:hypothetical protein
MFGKIKGYVSVSFQWIKQHKYLVVSIVFFVIVFLIDDNSMVGHISNQRKIDELESEIARMRKDSAKIMLLQSQLEENGDISEVERMGRAKYDMHKDNEDIFIIVE